MTPTETTDNNAMSGLAILFAAIDYHQSILSCVSIVPNTSDSPNGNFFQSANHSMDAMAESAAAMVGSTPEQDNEADFKWIDSVRKRKINKKTKKSRKKTLGSFLEKNKKSPAMDASSIQATLAAESYDISSFVSPAASFESFLASLDDSLSFDDDSLEMSHRERMLHMMRYELIRVTES